MSRSYWDKIELYIISLWLLFLLILIITIDVPVYFGENSQFIGLHELFRRNIIPMVSIMLILLGFLLVKRFNYKLKGSNRTALKITKIENKNYEHLTFLTTYIIPLICFDLGNTKYIIVLFILLVIIGAIYVKTDLFYANPTLALLGFHVYQVDAEFRTENKENVIIISRGKLEINSRVFYRKLDDKIYYGRCTNE